MYVTLYDHIYWLNAYILSFSDGIAIPNKSILLHNVSWTRFIFCSKRMKTIQARKITIMCWSYSS